MNTSHDSLFKELYSKLNSEQKKAVDCIEGPVVVNAGPGTGKTQILTLRIANILKTQGSDMAENILALTFTNAGVAAMRKRLASIIGSEAYRVGIFTFHSFAEYLMKNKPDVFSEMLGFQAITDVERYSVVSEIIKKTQLDILKPFAAPVYYVPSVLSAIDSLKRDNVSPDQLAQWNEELKKTILNSEDSFYKRNGKTFKKGDQKPDILKPYEKNKELIVVYQAYQDSLQDKKKYDFNDMILNVIEMIESHADFQYELQEQYQYVLVDEHQDTNAAQNKIIDLLLAAEHLDERPNIFTVGDDKQAIYRFQGASLENFLSFESRYKDVSIIHLQENYRSGQQVLDAATALINQDSSERTHVELNAQCADSAVEVHVFNAYDDELDWLAQKIDVLQKNGTKLREIAVMYRENKHTKDIQNTLARYGIPSVVMAKQNILDTSLVRKIVMLLTAVDDLTNNRNLAELLYSNVFETSTYDVIKIMERFKRNKKDKHTGTKHLFKILADKKILKEIDIENPDIFVSIAQTLQLCSSTFASDNFLSAYDELVRQSGILSSIFESEDSHNQLRFYDCLYQEFRALVDSNMHTSITDVLQHLETLDEFNIALEASPQDHIDGVRLLTAHKSKGLEYEYVFITNVVDKVWGNKTVRKQFTLPVGEAAGDNDDERRLLYVGITRAMKQCYVSYAQQSGEKQLAPSSFIYDILREHDKPYTHEHSISFEEKYQVYDRSVLRTSLLDDDLLRALYEKRTLSVTALNNYIDCPARYFVNNLLQVPSTYSRSLAYGSLMHRALELFFRESQQNAELLEKKRLIELFVDAVEGDFLEEVEKRDIIQKGTQSLEGYYDSNSASWSFRVENEVRIAGVELALQGSTVTLAGVLDKIEKEENDITSIRVVDYKTGKTYSEKTKEQKDSLERQLIFYSLLLNLYRDGFYTMSSAVLDFVEPSKKTGEYEMHQMSPSINDREELIGLIQEMDNDIRAGSSFLDKRCNKNDCEACRLVNLMHK